MADKRRPFSHPRYATRGIVSTLEPALQMELWGMIEFLSAHRPGGVDYLQVFDLRKQGGELNQAITHSQEQPPYRATNAVQVSDPVDTRVFVIDDGPYATMLLASEY